MTLVINKILLLLYGFVCFFKNILYGIGLCFKLQNSRFKLCKSKKLCESIFSYGMPGSILGNARMVIFLYDFKAGKVVGVIVHNAELATPTKGGTLVYLNCQPYLQVVLNRIGGVRG